jgi:cell cycle sensor histidine kinase DivJ
VALVREQGDMSERLAGWVHETAQACPARRGRHAAFIRSRLLAALAVCVVAPPYLALRGAPALWETLVFLLALAPLASLVLLSRTGDLLAAHALGACACILASLTIACGLGGLSGAALIWLGLAPMQAIFARSARLVAGVSAASLVALGLIVTGVATGVMPADAHDALGLNGAYMAAGLACAAAIAYGASDADLNRERTREMGDARLATLAGALGDPQLRHDRNGLVLEVSRESEAMFGLSARDLSGRGLFERIFVQDRPAFLKALSQAHNGAATVRVELRLRIGATNLESGFHAEPVFRWVELRARRLMLDGRSASEADGACVTSILRDISREKRAELDREEALAAADRANASKDRFLANLSHELRTPLNAIIGFSEILANEAIMPDAMMRRREYAGIINASGQHLLSVVNAILDMSKIEAGCFAIESEALDVAPLIEACCDMIKLKAEQSGLLLERDCAQGLPQLVADERACKQILINLLSNAVKFTPAGGQVRVIARLEGRSLAIEVSDTGVGVKQSDLPRLGDAFFQSGATGSGKGEGTGLGLSVVRGLVGLHGGAISIASVLGQGTSVKVLLPIDGGASAQKRASATIDVIPPAVQTAPVVPLAKVKKVA